MSGNQYPYDLAYEVSGGPYPHWTSTALWWARALIFAAAVFTGIARFAVKQPGIDKADFFKDWSHLFVAYVVGVAATSWWWKVGHWKFYAVIAAALIVAEVTAAVLTAKGIL